MNAKACDEIKKKIEKKINLALRVVATSVVTIFGIILTIKIS